MLPDLSGLDALNIAAFLFCVLFCAYVVGILVPFFRAKPAGTGDPAQYDWHVIVPCLNEEAVIATTVRRLLADFPTVTVWCVDDASSDGTGAILAGLEARDERVRVIRRRLPLAQQGKGAALNAAWRAINTAVSKHANRKSTIVAVLDADSELHGDCFNILTAPAYFGDPDVSAIQIEVRMNHAHLGAGIDRPGPLQRILVRMQDMEFRGPISAMQQLRRRTGSVALGGNGQFSRLSALNAIAAVHGTPWHGALLEDFELGLHVLLTGGRTEYVQETWVAQEAILTLRPLLRQRARWAQGSMQCMRYLYAILRSKHISNSAALELVYFLFLPWIQLSATLVYAGSTAVLGWYMYQAPDHIVGWWHEGGWSVIPLIVAFGIVPFAIWGPIYRKRSESDLSFLQAVGLGVSHWIYSYAQSVSTWMAFIRMVRAQSDWQKTRRAGDRPLATRNARTPVRLLVRHAPVAVDLAAHHTEVPGNEVLPAQVFSDRHSGGGRRSAGTVYVLAGNGRYIPEHG